MLHLSSVVSRVHPGDSDEMRLPLREEGLSMQEIKGEDVPDVARLSASGDQEPRAVDPPSDSDSDSKDEEPQQDSADPEFEAGDSEEEEEQGEEDTVQSFSSLRTRATSGRRSYAQHAGTPGGSPAAAPPPTPKASSSSLPTAVPEVVRRAAPKLTGKRKQPETGEEESPSSSVGRQHLRRRTATTDLPVNEESQRRQECSTADEARKRCDC